VIAWSTKIYIGGKGKVKFNLEQATKAKRGSRVIALSLTSALDGGGWSTPGSGRFTPGKKIQYHCVGGWMGPQCRFGRVRKISPPPPPTGIRSPERPARGQHWRIVLKWILDGIGSQGLFLSSLGLRQLAGCCDIRNEPSGPIQ